MRKSRSIICVLLVAAALGTSGCTYMQHRGDDAKDIFDVGLTVSSKPQFSLYAGMLGIVSLGYSNLDGTLYGLGGREFGALPVRQNAYGLLLWGHEQFGYEDFDLPDPDSPEPWNVGVLRLPGDKPIPAGQTVNCPKMLHVGWLGLTLNCRFGQLADFLLGWTRLDIMDDDTAD